MSYLDLIQLEKQIRKSDGKNTSRSDEDASKCQRDVYQCDKCIQRFIHCKPRHGENIGANEAPKEQVKKYIHNVSLEGNTQRVLDERRDAGPDSYFDV
jgi:hypothetical protein